MPELPEVEVVRAGVEAAIAGCTLLSAAVYHPRTERKIPGGAAALSAALVGQRVQGVARRGKYMWVLFEDAITGAAADQALVIHLGMSGQLLVNDAAFDAATHHYEAGKRHERARFEFAGAAGSESEGALTLRFIDQRTFGYIALSPLVAGPHGRFVPQLAAHIAPDALELSTPELVHRLAGQPREIKRILLDQAAVAGIGNIYADEALFAARINPHARRLGRERARLLARSIQEILLRSLAAGGTSFDQLYRNASGEAGYFARELAVYGKAGQPCPRCATPIRAQAFLGRHAHYCPSCQRR